MVSLTEMLKQQKVPAKPVNQESNGNVRPNDDSDGGTLSVGDEETTPDAQCDAPVESGAVPQDEATAPQPKPIVKPLKLGTLKLGGKPSPRSDSIPDAKPKPSTQTNTDSNNTTDDTNGNPSPSGKSASGGLSLISIAGLDDADDSKLNGVDDSEEGYLDQVPATAPVRGLPAELDDQQKGFVKSLDAIYSLHSEPDLFVDMVSKIMSDMADNPALAELLADEDSNAMIRGLRQSAGLAQVKKQESKAKRGGKSTKPNPKLDEAMATLQGLAGFNLTED